MTTLIPKFEQAYANAVNRPINQKLAETISVKDFGAKGDGVTDDTAAFLAARDALQTAGYTRGGVIRVPAGQYVLSQEWAFTSDATQLLHNIYIEGDGPDNTALNFSTAPSGTNGISFNKGAHFGIKGLQIVNAPANGVFIGKGNTGTDYSLLYRLENIQCQSCGTNGLQGINTYMGTIEDSWFRNNTSVGVVYTGFHTSLSFKRCYALNNSYGYTLNGIIYSHFDVCSADSNTHQGYVCSNLRAVNFTACGTENNAADGWEFFTSTASSTGIPTQAQDIHGVVLDSCYGLGNSTGSPGSYATFVTTATADNRPINIKIVGGSASPATTSDKCLISAATSGAITLTVDGLYYDGFTSPDYQAGAVYKLNQAITGLQVLAANNADQSLASGSLTTIALQGITYNQLNATIASNAITIPTGINRISVTAQILWQANGTGSRYVGILKNGNPVATQRVTASTEQEPQLLTSQVIEVAVGDTISFNAVQTSGSSINILNGSFVVIQAIS